MNARIEIADLHQDQGHNHGGPQGPFALHSQTGRLVPVPVQGGGTQQAKQHQRIGQYAHIAVVPEKVAGQVGINVLQL